MQDADTIVAQAQNAIMRSVRPDTLGTKGRLWRKAVVDVRILDLANRDWT